MITACLELLSKTEIYIVLLLELIVQTSTAGLKVNNQLVAYATRFSAVRLKNYLWSHHRALKAKVQCDFSSAYSPDHTNVLNTNLNIDITQPGTKL